MSHPELTLLSPPYDRLAPIEVTQDVVRRCARSPGSALLWNLEDVRRHQVVREVVGARPGGLALVVVLPTPTDIERLPEVVHAVQRCRPHGLMPRHDGIAVADVAAVLRRPPLDLPSEVTDYLAWRGLVVDRDTTHLLRRIIELSAELRTITALSRSLYLSRRALGRRLLTRGLPVPSHWLQLGRILRVSTRLQNTEVSVSALAYEEGYPDGFSLSNQMHRLIGVRPSQVRDHLGWEWILEAWLRREAESGGLAPRAADEINAGARTGTVPMILPAVHRGRPGRRISPT